MAINGEKTTSLPKTTVADEVLVNRSGNTMAMNMDHLAVQMQAATGPNYESRPGLFADLAWPEGTLGKVWGDANSDYRGVYKKTGSSGQGNWLRIGPVPEGDAANLIAEQDARIAADLQEAQARKRADAAMPVQSSLHSRPGDASSQFVTSIAGGDPVELPTVPEALVRFSDAGRVVRVVGGAIIAARGMFPIEPGKRYQGEVAVQRRVNSPFADVIRFAIAWYDQNRVHIGETVVRDFGGVTTGSGRLSHSVLVARAAGDGIGVVAPVSARYCRPFVQTFGTDAQDDIEVIRWTDISNAAVIAPDLSALEARMATQESMDAGGRLIALEEQVTAPGVLRVKTLADALSSTPPISVDVIEVLGLSSPGDGGELSYARSPTPSENGIVLADSSTWEPVGGRRAVPAAARRVFLTSDHQIKKTPDQLDRLNITWNDISRMDADAIYMLGDVVDIGSLGHPDQFDFDAYLDVLYSKNINPAKIFFIPGNHDNGGTHGGTWIEEGNRNLLNYLSRFKRPPFYFLLTGNTCDIFIGYTTWSTAQQLQKIVIDWLVGVLRKFSHSHNIILHTHAALYDTVGGGGNASTADGFYLKPKVEFKAVLDKYPVDAVFCGHNAIDLVASNEVDHKTYAAFSTARGNVPVFLTGPHIEQAAVWTAPAFSLAGLLVTYRNGAATAVVQMRNHREKNFVAAKQRTFNLRFPARLSPETMDFGHGVSPEIPMFTDTLRQYIGLSDGIPGREVGNAAAAVIVKRRLATDFVRVDVAAADVPNGAEFLDRRTLPGDTVTDGGTGDGYSTVGNEVGGSVLFGARKLSSEDANMATGFAIYGTTAAGAEEEILRPILEGPQLFKGSHYPSSEKLPFFHAMQSGAVALVNGKIAPYTTEVYDDFDQFDPVSGVFTCSQRGVYRFDAQVSLAGGNVTEDLISLQIIRKSGAAEAAFAAEDFNSVVMVNANSRATLKLTGITSFYAGEQCWLAFADIAGATVINRTRVYFSATLLRAHVVA